MERKNVLSNLFQKKIKKSKNFEIYSYLNYYKVKLKNGQTFKVDYAKFPKNPKFLKKFIIVKKIDGGFNLLDTEGNFLLKKSYLYISDFYKYLKVVEDLETFKENLLDENLNLVLEEWVQHIDYDYFLSPNYCVCTEIKNRKLKKFIYDLKKKKKLNVGDFYSIFIESKYFAVGELNNFLKQPITERKAYLISLINEKSIEFDVPFYLIDDNIAIVSIKNKLYAFNTNLEKIEIENLEINKNKVYNFVLVKNKLLQKDYFEVLVHVFDEGKTDNYVLTGKIIIDFKYKKAKYIKLD